MFVLSIAKINSSIDVKMGEAAIKLLLEIIYSAYSDVDFIYSAFKHAHDYKDTVKRN